MVRYWNLIEKIGDARALDQPRIDTRHADKAFGQLVVEHVLADRDENGGEELLAEEHERCAECDVFAR